VEDRGLGEELDERSVTSAWALVDYFKAQAREVYSLLDRSALDARAEALTDWMRRRDTRRVTTRDVCRHNVAGIKTASEARDLFQHVQDLGWGMTVLPGGRGPQTITFVLGGEEATAD
ncbi:MAG: hypothetical protein J2P43_11320, partial [Candidatus Dormibacteraeota bacterium]|nr:hypothetical protein [Candidatus Dormibacteraeota bacterium]